MFWLNWSRLIKMSDALLDFETLKRKGRCKSSTDVVVWLVKEEVHFKRDSRGDPITTLDAFNKALGLGEITDIVEVE